MTTSPASRPRRTAAAGLLLLALGGAAGCTVGAPEETSVTWASSEDGPTCAYDPESETVDARLVVTWGEDDLETMDVYVSVYSEENTNFFVGGAGETIESDGEATTEATVTIPVTSPPHRGEDGETACKLASGSATIEGIDGLPDEGGAS